MNSLEPDCAGVRVVGVVGDHEVTGGALKHRDDCVNNKQPPMVFSELRHLRWSVVAYLQPDRPCRPSNDLTIAACIAPEIICPIA